MYYSWLCRATGAAECDHSHATMLTRPGSFLLSFGCLLCHTAAGVLEGQVPGQNHNPARQPREQTGEYVSVQQAPALACNCRQIAQSTRRGCPPDSAIGHWAVSGGIGTAEGISLQAWVMTRAHRSVPSVSVPCAEFRSLKCMDSTTSACASMGTRMCGSCSQISSTTFLLQPW